MTKLRTRRRDDAITFEVRVAPRASRNRILGSQEGVLKVALTAPPVDGAANEALRTLLAKALGVSKSSVVIVQGERARNKVVRVRGTDISRLEVDDFS